MAAQRDCLRRDGPSTLIFYSRSYPFHLFFSCLCFFGGGKSSSLLFLEKGVVDFTRCDCDNGPKLKLHPREPASKRGSVA